MHVRYLFWLHSTSTSELGTYTKPIRRVQCIKDGLANVSKGVYNIFDDVDDTQYFAHITKDLRGRMDKEGTQEFEQLERATNLTTKVYLGHVLTLARRGQRSCTQIRRLGVRLSR